MGDVLHIPDQKNPFMGIPPINPNNEIAQNTERIAIGLDMLVGLLSEHWGYELKEEKLNGNTVLRWRPINSKETEGETKESTDSEA